MPEAEAVVVGPTASSGRLRVSVTSLLAVNCANRLLLNPLPSCRDHFVL